MARKPDGNGDCIPTFEEYLESRQVGPQCFTCTNCTEQALGEIRRFVERNKSGERKASISSLHEYLVKHHGYPPGIGKLRNHINGCLGL